MYLGQATHVRPGGRMQEAGQAGVKDISRSLFVTFGEGCGDESLGMC